ncbi:hypothetical protein CI102_10868 [Trichoderma harzianum]|nr:hypothetical protein CI102_10868 [Trichoderma harzianum]
MGVFYHAKSSSVANISHIRRGCASALLPDESSGVRDRFRPRSPLWSRCRCLPPPQPLSRLQFPHSESSSLDRCRCASDSSWGSGWNGSNDPLLTLSLCRIIFASPLTIGKSTSLKTISRSSMCADGSLFHLVNVCVFAHDRYFDCDVGAFSRCRASATVTLRILVSGPVPFA